MSTNDIVPDKPDDADLGFRALQPADLPLLHDWLNRPGETFRWYAYEKATTLQEIEAVYRGYLDGADPGRACLMTIRDRPIGYIQMYHHRDHPTFWAHLGMLDAAGVDLFIGEKTYQHRGLGPRLLRRFVEELVFADPTIAVCVIDPDPANAIAIRAYEKVGFRHVATIGPPEHVESAYLMRLDRTP